MSIKITEAAAKAALERFAKVQRKSHFACPRCGAWAMAKDPIRNALSRHAAVQICDKCGTDEAIRDFIGKPLPLAEWSIMSVFFELSAIEEPLPNE